MDRRHPPSRRRRSAHPVALATAALVGTLLVPLPARAQAAAPPDTAEENERLHELFERAGRALDREDFAEAVRLLTEVWQARRTADVAANLAVAELGLGDPAAAGRHAAFAKRHLLPSATREQRDAIEVLLARARSEAAVLVIEVEPAGAEVRVNGERIVPEERAELFVTPGDQTVVATRYDATTERRVTVAPGARQQVTFRLESPPPPEDLPAAAPGPRVTHAAPAGGVADARRREPSPVPLLASLGVALAGSGMAVGYGLAADRAGDDADVVSAALGTSDSACFESSDPRCADLAALRDQEARRQDLKLVGVAVAGAGAAAAIVSGVVYVARLHPRARPAASAPGAVTAGLDLGATGARFALRVRF